MQNLKDKIHQLSAPYVKSDAYKLFGNVHPNKDEPSVFWKTKVDYVVKYKTLDLNTQEEQQQVKKLVRERKQ